MPSVHIIIQEKKNYQKTRLTIHIESKNLIKCQDQFFSRKRNLRLKEYRIDIDDNNEQRRYVC